MYIKNKKGQSTVEYVLLMTAVVAVIIALVTGKNSGLQGTLTNTLNATISTQSDIADRLTNSENGTIAKADPKAGIPPYSISVANGM